MPKQSAGLLIHRRRLGAVEVLLVHPGGPLWKNKDQGAWSIPKGEPEPGEQLAHVALREAREELGLDIDAPRLLPLAPVKQRGGKWVHAFSLEADIDVSRLRSNEFEMVWPPRSGKLSSFPEVDRAEYFSVEVARTKINPGQVALLHELEQLLERDHA